MPYVPHPLRCGWCGWYSLALFAFGRVHSVESAVPVSCTSAIASSFKMHVSACLGRLHVAMVRFDRNTLCAPAVPSTVRKPHPTSSNVPARIRTILYLSLWSYGWTLARMSTPKSDQSCRKGKSRRVGARRTGPGGLTENRRLRLRSLLLQAPHRLTCHVLRH